MPGLACPQFSADNPAPPPFHRRKIAAESIACRTFPISLLTRVTYAQQRNKSFIFMDGGEGDPPVRTGRMPDRTDREHS